MSQYWKNNKGNIEDLFHNVNTSEALFSIVNRLATKYDFDLSEPINYNFKTNTLCLTEMNKGKHSFNI